MIVRTLAAAGVVAWLAAAAPPPSLDRFDLLCTGTREEPDVSGARTTRTPFREELRVDLKAMRYCSDQCEGVLPITSVTADQITFEDRPQSVDRAEAQLSHYVHRDDGYYADLYSEAPPKTGWVSKQGSCRPVAFKPFPTVRQMF